MQPLCDRTPQKTSEALSRCEGGGDTFRLFGDWKQQEIIFALVISLPVEVL
jgi:hypothetical protein